jgi:hypothetical protein
MSVIGRREEGLFMSVEEDRWSFLTLNDLFPLSSMLKIFEKRHRAEITGDRNDRVAAKFGLSRIYLPQNQAGFIRHEVYSAAIVLDAVNAGILREPELSGWPAMVQEHMLCRFTTLIRELGEQALCFNRARQEAGSLFLYPAFTLDQYLTVDQVATREGVSRETVYQRSTVRHTTYRHQQERRLDGDPLYYTVSFSGITLFLPLSCET